VEDAGAGGDAAVLGDGAAAGGLGDDDAAIAPDRARARARAQKRADAAARTCLLVGGEQEGGVAPGPARRDDQRRGRALDVAGAEADRSILRDAQSVRILSPPRVRGHRVDVHVEQQRGAAARRQEAHAAVSQILDFTRESGAERVGEGREDPAAIDGPRRVPRVGGDEALEQREDLGERVGHLRA